MTLSCSGTVTWAEAGEQLDPELRAVADQFKGASWFPAAWNKWYGPVRASGRVEQACRLLSVDKYSVVHSQRSAIHAAAVRWSTMAVMRWDSFVGTLTGIGHVRRT